MRRRVADEEDHLQRLLVLAPGDLGDGFVEGLIDALGKVTAPLGLERLQLRVDGIEIVGEIGDFGDVGVAAIAKGDEAHLENRSWRAGGDLVADGPDFLLGRADQASHATGGIEAEYDFDVRPSRRPGLLGVRERSGRQEGGE